MAEWQGSVLGKDYWVLGPAGGLTLSLTQGHATARRDPEAGA